MHSYAYAAWLALQGIVFAICLVLMALTGFCVVACLWPCDVLLRIFKRQRSRNPKLVGVETNVAVGNRG